MSVKVCEGEAGVRGAKTLSNAGAKALSNAGAKTLS